MYEKRGGDMTTGFPNQWIGKPAQAKALLSKLDWFLFWFVLVCVYMSFGSIRYLLYAFFFGGGVSIHFFATWNVNWGGVISKSGRNVWRQFPNKKCRQFKGRKVCNVGEVPPPPIYIFKGAGRENLSKSSKNNFQIRKPIKIQTKITFKYENLSRS